MPIAIADRPGITALAGFTGSNPAAIQFDARSAPVTAAGALVLQYAHTVGSGNDRILIVKVTTDGANATQHTARWGGAGGTVLTKAGESINGLTWASIHRLLAPASGTNNVHVTVSTSATTTISSEAMSLANVAQEAPQFASGTASNATAVQASSTLTPTGNSSWCEAVCCNSDQGVTDGTPTAPLVRTTDLGASNHRYHSAMAQPLNSPITPRWSFGVAVTTLALAAVMVRPVGGAVTRNASGNVDIPAVTGTGDATAPSAFTEVSSTNFDHQTAFADPWNDTVTIPAGANRVLLDCIGMATPGTDTCVIDPAGANIALTELTGSPQAFGTGETAIGFVLLEANFPTTGSKTLRHDNSVGTRKGGRHVVILSGARQTVSSSGANHDVNGPLTVSTNRTGGGNFPAGTRVYTWCHVEGDTQTYTVTGDATGVTDIADGNGDRWVFAAGTLAAPAASVTATFTRGGNAQVRKNAIIVAVEPAA